MSAGVELEVEQLVDIVFLKNVNNNRIDLALQGIEHQFDLFCFCTDMLTKGLVKMYGTNNALNLDSITHDQFEVAKKRMACAGVKVMIDAHPHNENNSFGVFFPKQHLDDPFDDLTKYAILIHSANADMKISFELVRNM